MRKGTAAMVLCVGMSASLVKAEDAQTSAIPANLTQLRPIQCIAYDPKPSDFPQPAYFDSDFFNSDFTALWGDDGKPGARKDLTTFAGVRLNMLHLYNWNPQRVNHTAFLDAANQQGLKVMVPINNFTAQTITGTTDCPTCPNGYKAAYNIIKGIFNQVYINGSKTPHPAAAMWGIYNEFDLTGYDPVNVVFVAQAILTLENEAGIPTANRLPITAPVSDATWQHAARQGRPPALRAALDRAAQQWLAINPGKTDSDIPGAVLPIMAVSNTLSDSQNRTTYRSSFDAGGPVVVSAVPSDFWTTRWIASSNPFREGDALVEYLTSPAQFQSAWPGTTAFNTLPPLFFGEMGYSQKDAGGHPPSPPSAAVLERQAKVVLGQIQKTAPLARSGGTPQGYFLGSCFFQHTRVDASWFQAFDFGSFSNRNASSTAPCPACGASWRVDTLNPLPQWNSVKSGYAGSSLATLPDPRDPVTIEPRD